MKFKATVSTLSQTEVDARFVEIVGKLDVTKLATFGSAMLSLDDEDSE